MGRTCPRVPPLRAAAGAEVGDAMQLVPGVADLRLEQQMDVPQLRIQADRRALARDGMTVGPLACAIDVAFNGEVVSQVREEGAKRGSRRSS